MLKDLSKPFSQLKKDEIVQLYKDTDKALQNAVKEIEALNVKIEQLNKELAIAYDTVSKSEGLKEFDDMEILARNQIALIKVDAEQQQRKLTEEEVNILDKLYKNLRLAQGKSTTINTKADRVKLAKKDSLLQIASSKIESTKE